MGILPAGGGVKTDEADHESVCAVSAVLTPQGKEEIGKNHLIQFSGAQSYLFASKTAMEEKQEKVV